MSNDFYHALNRDNVELITDPVTAITKTGIRSKNVDSGVTEDREIDVLIWATGNSPITHCDLIKQTRKREKKVNNILILPPLPPRLQATT